jgi:hypothetical protein
VAALVVMVVVTTVTKRERESVKVSEITEKQITLLGPNSDILSLPFKSQEIQFWLILANSHHHQLASPLVSV